jgi:hypothetical protein
LVEADKAVDMAATGDTIDWIFQGDTVVVVVEGKVG